MVKSKIYKLEQNKKHNEPEIFFKLRDKFINELKPKNEKELELLSMYSKILVNMVYLKCRYSDKTEKNLLKYLKKIKMNNII